jgi:DNA-binding transcriptional ArsR family regulator
MSTPLHQLKAEFFKTLGHPTRIRVLEILAERECSVGEMLQEMDIEASNLSQQLAVLRRAGVVSSRREGSTVYYALADPQIAELLAVARHILTSMLTVHAGLLAGIREEITPSAQAPRRSRRATGGRG